MVTDISTLFPLGDFLLFRQFGAMLLAGENPYQTGTFYYPLSAGLWLFVPFALLPFGVSVAIWLLASILSIWGALGKPGVVVWLSYPFLLAAKVGQIDALLVAPAAWLMSDTPLLAPLGAAILTLKPQIAWALIGYMLCRWIFRRNTRQLLVFAAALVVFYLPTFIYNPRWVADWLASLPGRARLDDTVMLWDLPWLLVAPVLVILAYTVLKSNHRPQLIHLAGLMITPSLFIYDYVLAAASLPKSYKTVSLATALTWVLVLFAAIVDRGQTRAYVFIPLLTLLIVWQRGGSPNHVSG